MVPIDNFWKDKRKKDGLQGHCIDCQKKRNRANREKNPEYFKQWAKENYENRPEGFNKDRYQKHREAYLQRRDDWSRSVRGRLSDLLSASRGRSGRNGLDHTLTLDWLMDQYERQNGRCALTGIEFRFERNADGKRHFTPFGPSLDRIDPKRGYTPDNVRLVCVIVNLSLNDFGEEVFRTMCEAYVNNTRNSA